MSSQSPDLEGVDETVPPLEIRLPLAGISQDRVEVGRPPAEILSSFNWIQTPDKMPIIAVPGHPPRWIPRVPPGRLPSDKENNRNRQRFPLHPHAFEPLLISLAVCRPEFDLSKVDLVTQLRNLRQLFFFARGKQEGFRIDIELFGTTIFMNRWGDPITIANGSHSGHSCGHVFQEQTTRYCPDLLAVQVNSHHRVIKYDLRGLQLVVQHEVDTYACGCHAECKSDTGPIYVKNDDQIKPNFSSCPDLDTSLRVLRHGSSTHLFDSECIAEIKTKKGKNEPEMDNWAASQLWFSRSCNMLFGYHTDRKFNGVTKTPENKSDALDKWHEKRQEDIRQVAGIIECVIQWIQSPVGRSASRKFALIRGGEEEKHFLKLYQLREDYQENMLPLKEAKNKPR
ncbi:hypothetical protein DM02DRAFT_732472 [Periconia macrospinosa]|uniref:Uncharacterized protein n=1 Tax=Periconia macrospinosa TaxID=97972 RepID=A0A2V1D8U6_9PLEO|nr:hypothetical protein DM02DRAFT_732472 [Periconia macrospinosa]